MEALGVPVGLIMLGDVVCVAVIAALPTGDAVMPAPVEGNHITLLY